MVVVPGIVYYVFEFADLATAQSDLVVGALHFDEVLVFGDLTVNSVAANTGFWCVVLQINQLSLLTHPNLQVAFDGQFVVITTKIPTDNIGIVMNAITNFVDGLHRHISRAYITEDSVSFYITEDASKVYVES